MEGHEGYKEVNIYQDYDKLIEAINAQVKVLDIEDGNFLRCISYLFMAIEDGRPIFVGENWIMNDDRITQKYSYHQILYHLGIDEGNFIRKSPHWAGEFIHNRLPNGLFEIEELK